MVDEPMRRLGLSIALYALVVGGLYYTLSREDVLAWMFRPWVEQMWREGRE
jgi:hypothetical protein